MSAELDRQEKTQRLLDAQTIANAETMIAYAQKNIATFKESRESTALMIDDVNASIKINEELRAKLEYQLLSDDTDIAQSERLLNETKATMIAAKESIAAAEEVHRNRNR